MLFIAGIERSATTWVSNLLEAHPAATVFVEPMSKFTTQFKQWPNRFVKIDDLKIQAAYFLKEFDIIKQRKYWLLSRLSEHHWAWNFDLKLAESLMHINLATDYINDFHEINFHRKGQPYAVSKSTINLEVIKELRLNFNTVLIKYIDPRSKVVVVLRDMSANIHSILEQMRKGNLIELRELLLEYYGKIDEETIFNYWRDSYSSLLEGLENEGIDHYVLEHTQLLINTEETICSLFDFIGLSNFSSVFKYIRETNKSGYGIHNTQRDHAMLIKRNQQAREKILPLLVDVLDTSTLHPVLSKVIYNSLA